jgi:hypothetical protein
MADDGPLSRGKGIFYDLNGSNASAGELMAWSWGISRLIDALATTPGSKIDVRHLAVTGCSRNGKGALVAGAFDERIALTIPQEPGSGGASAWRLVADEIASGTKVQPLAEATTEAAWFQKDFGTVYGNAPGKLPVDHHELAAMVAPRGLLVIENSIDWLGLNSTYGTGKAAAEIFGAMGADSSFTYSQDSTHDHCALPSDQYHWVQSFVKKFLLGQTGEAPAVESQVPRVFDRSKWIPWTVPVLR